MLKHHKLAVVNISSLLCRLRASISDTALSASPDTGAVEGKEPT
jgi:hypothetical protein